MYTCLVFKFIHNYKHNYFMYERKGIEIQIKWLVYYSKEMWLVSA